ncbi:hypothetical protein [Capnocytophaga catalasegens]|uniref:hypothetical protein n=1 Tax=Capnocytophaga catalasegens TaxID=1004260 RepID=UPI00222E407B|nr:hypothetical protein [Capnocytophaga catalasegens]
MNEAQKRKASTSLSLTHSNILLTMFLYSFGRMQYTPTCSPDITFKQKNSAWFEDFQNQTELYFKYIIKISIVV